MITDTPEALKEKDEDRSETYMDLIANNTFLPTITSKDVLHRLAKAFGLPEEFLK